MKENCLARTTSIYHNTKFQRCMSSSFREGTYEHTDGDHHAIVRRKERTQNECKSKYYLMTRKNIISSAHDQSNKKIDIWKNLSRI
jgi:hypothetical protein